MGLYMAKFTKKAIRISLLKLLEKNEIEKISVKDICELCEITRNTFYYYYSDIYQVLEELLKTEADNVIMKNQEYDSFEEEFLQRYHLILEYKQAVYHLYHSKNRDMILKYFCDVTEDFVKKYVKNEAVGTKLSEDDVNYVTYFYSNSIIGTTLRWLHDGMKDSQEELIYRLSLSFQSTIKPLISELDQKTKH